MPVLLDTCAAIYLFHDPYKLSPETVFKISQGALMLSISVAEIACKIKAGKLLIGEGYTIEDIVYQLSMLKNFSIVDITSEIWIDGVFLDWEDHKDPADRVILAYAKKRNLSLVTSDEKMRTIYSECII